MVLSPSYAWWTQSHKNPEQGHIATRFLSPGWLWSCAGRTTTAPTVASCWGGTRWSVVTWSCWGTPWWRCHTSSGTPWPMLPMRTKCNTSETRYFQIDNSTFSPLIDPLAAGFLQEYVTKPQERNKKWPLRFSADKLVEGFEEWVLLFFVSLIADFLQEDFTKLQCNEEKLLSFLRMSYYLFAHLNMATISLSQLLGCGFPTRRRHQAVGREQKMAATMQWRKM